MAKLTIQPKIATIVINTAKKSKTAEFDSSKGISVKFVEIFQVMLFIVVCLK